MKARLLNSLLTLFCGRGTGGEGRQPRRWPTPRTCGRTRKGQRSPHCGVRSSGGAAAPTAKRGTGGSRATAASPRSATGPAQQPPTPPPPPSGQLGVLPPRLFPSRWARLCAGGGARSGGSVAARSVTGRLPRQWMACPSLPPIGSASLVDGKPTTPHADSAAPHPPPPLPAGAAPRRSGKIQSTTKSSRSDRHRGCVSLQICHTRRALNGRPVGASAEALLKPLRFALPGVVQAGT